MVLSGCCCDDVRRRAGGFGVLAIVGHAVPAWQKQCHAPVIDPPALFIVRKCYRRRGDSDLSDTRRNGARARRLLKLMRCSLPSGKVSEETSESWREMSWESEQDGAGQSNLIFLR